MTTPIPRYTAIRGRQVPLTARGTLPAFHCPHCGRRHSSAGIAIDCAREQGMLPGAAR